MGSRGGKRCRSRDGLVEHIGMTMIERVAASIVIAQKRGLDRNGVARAAIEAMREPEVEMIAAFWRQKNRGAQDPGEWSEFRSDYDAYRAMIDQALKDEA